MTRLGRRALLLVAFCLCASAATAFVKCAWALWTLNAKIEWIFRSSVSLRDLANLKYLPDTGTRAWQGGAR